MNKGVCAVWQVRYEHGTIRVPITCIRDIGGTWCAVAPVACGGHLLGHMEMRAFSAASGVGNP